MALTPGLLLSERYRLSARIAVGGMGEVWSADDTRLGRQVAVKILRPELTSDPEFVDRFRTEARITASLNHSGIAAVYDYGEVASIAGGPEDTAFLVMELVNGEPLSAVLARQQRIAVPRVLDLLEQSGRALQAAHNRALVHRDIKPGNILITPAGQVKITDFGIAKVAFQVPITKGGMVMGTAQYLSPEQAAGHPAVPASDIYALGVVAFECLAGERPFNGESAVAVATAQVNSPPPPLPPDIPPPVTALVMRMMAKDPRQRFDDGASVAAAIAAVRSGRAAVAARSVHLGPATTPAAAQAAHAAEAVHAAQLRTVGGDAPGRLMPGRASGQVLPHRSVAGRPVRHTGLSWLIGLLVLLLAVLAGWYLSRLAADSSTGAATAPPPPASATVTSLMADVTPTGPVQLGQWAAVPAAARTAAAGGTTGQAARAAATGEGRR
jgi:predicted Ser/Thr protein kinase